MGTWQLASHGWSCGNTLSAPSMGKPTPCSLAMAHGLSLLTGCPDSLMLWSYRWFLASHLYRLLSFSQRSWPCTQVEGTYLLCCDWCVFSTACPEKPLVLIIPIDNHTLILPYSTVPYCIQSYSSLWFELWAKARTQGFAHAQQMLYHWALSPALFSLFILRQSFTKLPGMTLNSLFSPGRP